MTGVQLYISIGVPVLFNAAMFTVLMLYINAMLDGVDAKFQIVDAKIESLRAEMTARFEAQTQALYRVEGVLDARLRHL